MEVEIKEIIKILRIVKKYVSIQGSDVLTSSFNTNKEVIDCIDDHIKKLSNSDTSEIDDLIVLFLPTSDFQEISISNGWSEEYLEIARAFDILIELIKKKN